MCEEKNEKMKMGRKNVDFVLEIAREEKLEPISVRIRGEPYYMEEDETGIMDVLDMIFEMGQQIGGFVLNIEKTVPEFVTIRKGYRPNEFSKYYYNRTSLLATDGQTTFVSRIVDSDGNTHCDIYYKYKISNASFVLVIEHEENNFNDIDNQYLDIYLYGENEKLERVLRRLNDLLSP